MTFEIPGELTFCTIASAEYFPKLRIMLETFYRHNADLKFVIYSGDNFGQEFKAISANINLRRAGKINKSMPKRLAYSRYKPTMIKELLTEGAKTVIFIDPDMVIYSNLESLAIEVSNYSLTLTPHILNSKELGSLNGFESIFLASGQYNAGFIGVSNTKESLVFVNWWETRLHQTPSYQINGGFAFDQRWLDLAPCFIQKLRILRDPGVNVAYWNSSARNFSEVDGAILVNGSLLKIMHMSGYSQFLGPGATEYFANIKLNDFNSIVQDLFKNYSDQLMLYGFKQYPKSFGNVVFNYKSKIFREVNRAMKGCRAILGKIRDQVLH